MLKINKYPKKTNCRLNKIDKNTKKLTEEESLTSLTDDNLDYKLGFIVGDVNFDEVDFENAELVKKTLEVLKNSIISDAELAVFVQSNHLSKSALELLK